jgi:hypothetical protein
MFRRHKSFLSFLNFFLNFFFGIKKKLGGIFRENGERSGATSESKKTRKAYTMCPADNATAGSWAGVGLVN